MSKVSNPTKVITGKHTVFSYLTVNEPKVPLGGGTPKYSVSLIIPKSDTVTVEKIKAAIQAAYDEGQGKLKGNSKTVPALEDLSRIAVNTCRSMQRGSWFKSIFTHATEETADCEAELPPDYDPTVWNAVQALPEQLKSALVLRYWEGLPLQEAAATLGTNVNTLNTRIRKAKAILQENLKGWYFDEED